ncbi:CASP-like protein 1D1 [Eucalyptus grandis]|uniref:CASP-like protein 1D1 n=1 Tax=Eucalyptus grandis TaxID=71139 RepID=UPI00192ED1A4|nr:CASP-like protein 1D1 [Eucalyptus grandis]
MSTQEKVADPEVAKPAEAPPPKAEAPPPPAGPPNVASLLTADVALRGLLFALTLIALLVMVFSKQTKEVLLPGPPSEVLLPGPPSVAFVEAKFENSPAFIYFVAALSVACLYSIVTALASISAVLKPASSASFLLFFVVWDVVMLGLVASATGTAGGVAYIWLEGNSHVQWGKFCDAFGKFCQHLAASIAISLLADFVLILLIILSIFSLHKKIPQ